MPKTHLVLNCKGTMLSIFHCFHCKHPKHPKDPGTTKGLTMNFLPDVGIYPTYYGPFGATPDIGEGAQCTPY